MRYKRLLKLMEITEKMTDKGWRVDRARLHEHRTVALERIEKFQRMFMAQTRLEASDLGASGSGATHKVRDWFWLGQGAPHVVFNKLTKQPQFSTEALIIYATEFAGERFSAPAASLYALRKNKKLVEFCDTYLRFSEHDGRIHFGFNAAGTQTGRWTSSTKMRVVEADGTRRTYSCNAQQVPSKTPSFDFGEGKERLVDSLRDVFVADEGCVLFKTDFEALELRLIAYIHNSQRLIGWIERDEDTHIRNAQAIFRELKIPADAQQVKPAVTEMQKLINAARDAAKPLAYGVSYQMHDPNGHGKYPTLYKTLKKIFSSITEQQTNVYAERFFDLHPEIRDGQLRVRQSVEDLGYAELPIDGRRLYYPASPRGYNQALNFTMQSTGAALVNRALLALDETLDWRGEEVRAQVHDELVVQAPFKTMERIKENLERFMGEKAQLGATLAGVPAKADPGFTWGTTMAWDKFRDAHAEVRPWMTST